MILLKILALYTLAAVVFVVSWVIEQRHALTMAWLHSFAAAHEDVKQIWRDK